MLDVAKRTVADVAAGTLATCLRAVGPNAYRDMVNALWERQPVYTKTDVQLYLPERQHPNPQERPVVERIFAAFQSAKRDEPPHGDLFLAAGGWKKVMDSAFQPLHDAVRGNRLDVFHEFLCNFAASENQTGIEESKRFRRVAASSRKRLHFEQQVIGQLIHWWQVYESEGRDLSALRAPLTGNQGGFRVEGQVITPNAVYSDFYSRTLSRLLRREDPVIAELGAGHGRLAYFLNVQIPRSRYLIFDLPEMLCCSAYYLMLTFPQKRFLLYGEQELSPHHLGEFDFVLMPAYELKKLPDRSLDLFINENSLGVMPAAACQYFVGQICRTSRAIWHRNHEVRRNPFEDGTTSLINREYPIDPTEFALMMRHCDVERLIGNSLAASKNDMYWYYYQAISPTSGGNAG